MIDLNRTKMGYFILYQNNGGWTGNGIEDKQIDSGFSRDKAKYVHVDVSCGGQYAVRVNPPRTQLIDVTKTYPKGRKFCVVRYKNDLYQKKRRYKVAVWAASHCNLRYDFFGVIKFRLPWLFHRKSLYFCSENTLWALQKEHPEALKGLKPHECMPAHFLDKKHFEVVYEDTI